MGKFIFAFINFTCGIVYYSIGIYASKTKKPMHFWSGDCCAIKSYQVKDLKQYNMANSKMWKMYSSLYFINSIISYFYSIVGSIILGIVATIGIVPLSLYYETKIKKKYFLF